MPLNLNRHEYPEHHYYIDAWGALQIRRDIKSYENSFGATFLLWLAYDRPEELIPVLESFYKWDGKKWWLYRHPALWDKTSRDHWSYFIMFRKLIMGPMAFIDFVDRLPRLRGLNSWARTMAGYNTSYYFWNIPFARFGNIWLRFCRWVGRIGPETSNTWWISHLWLDSDTTSGEIYIEDRTIWQKLWSNVINLTIPAYSLHNKAWQVHLLQESKSKAKLQRILLKRVGKSNVMLRLLFGDEVTQEEIDSYPHMTGYRPGAYLNTTKRTIREMTEKEAEFNTFEKQLIIWLYEKT